MDNGQLARWTAQVEHQARMQAEKQAESFWRDIRPDDPDIRENQAVPSGHAQSAGGVLSFFKKRLAAFSVRPRPRQPSELAAVNCGPSKPFGPMT